MVDSMAIEPSRSPASPLAGVNRIRFEADLIDKLLKFPNQILPFVEAAPVWLRIWIYILIFLVFVTIAGVFVSYLISSQSLHEAASLERFSIDQPKDNEEVPLGEDRGWTLVGKFPTGAEAPGQAAKITINVFKLPSRELVQKDDSPLIDNVLGRWSFDALKFPGAGSFDIVANAAMGGQRTFREVRVKCVDKQLAFANSVAQDREFRGAAPLIKRTRDEISLPDRTSQLFELQYKFYAQYIQQRDLNAARETVTAALDLIDPVLPYFPNDLQLQNFRAYFLKDYWMIMHDLGKSEEAAWALDAASTMFGSVNRQDPHDPSAWNGLGSVAALRGDYGTALLYIDKALELAPNYAEAVHDRVEVLRAWEAQKHSAQERTGEPAVR
jgi:tetratricopeptide (TPR) repeat protein